MGSGVQSVKPGSDRYAFTLDPQHGRSCAVDEDFSQIDVASLADAEQLSLTSGRILPWNNAEPGGELPTPAEGCAVADRRNDGCRDNRSDAWDLANARAASVGRGDPLEFVVEFLNLLLDGLPLTPKRVDEVAHQRREVRFRVLEDIYAALIKSTTCHKEREDGTWAFQKPEGQDYANALLPLWRATDKLLLKKNARLNLADLYRRWGAPPYGVKAGCMPIIALAYYLANQKQLALYHDGLFAPELTAVHLDEWLQDPARVEWCFVEISASEQMLLTSVSVSLTRALGREVKPESLDSARALVALTMALPEWAKRTSNVSKEADLVRQHLLRANDPHRVLFVDIPSVLGNGTLASVPAILLKSLQELVEAYQKLLRSVEEQLFAFLDHRSTLDALRLRGATVSGISGEFRLDAFALRISEYGGKDDDIESLIALAVSKPSRDWTDRDIQAALVQLGQWSIEFRRIEALAPMKNRPATRKSFAVIFDQSGGNKTTSTSFDIGLDDAAAVKSYLEGIRTHKPRKASERKLFLAALVELGAELATEQNGDKS